MHFYIRSNISLKCSY